MLWSANVTMWRIKKKKPCTRKPQEKHMSETLSVVLPKRALIQMFDTTLNAECI